MNALDVTWNQSEIVAARQPHTTRRLVGLMAGVMLLVLLAGGLWGLQQWEVVARQKHQAALAGQQAAAFPPANAPPTFFHAALFQAEDQLRTAPPPKKVQRDVALPPAAPRKIIQVIETPSRNVYAPHEAIVREIHVKTGDQVKAGDLLMTLSSFKLEWDLIEARGKVAVAEAEFSALETQRLRLEKLVKTNAVPQQGLLELEAKIQRLKAELETHQRQLELLNKAQAELQLKSPAAGVVTTPRLADEFSGRPVNRGDLLLIIRLQEEKK